MGLFRRKRPAPQEVTRDQVAEGERELAAEMAAGAAAFVDEFADPDEAPLDYSRESLARVDEILGNFHRLGGTVLPGLIEGAASYVFEVARREFGGRYLTFSEDDPFVIVVGEPDVRVALCAISKVQGRIVNGDEDNIPFFYDGLVQALARRTDATII